MPLEIEDIALSLLRPDALNPRRVSDAELEALTRSIGEFGLVDPIIARREDMVIIAGHARALAARRLGLNQVPVILLDLPQDKARLLGIALNKIAGQFDDELLGHLLDDLAAIPDVDLTLTGFEAKEIQNLIRSLDRRERRQRVESFDLDAAMEATRAAVNVKPGELWALGPHRVLVGDACDQEAVARLIAGTRAVMAFTDPPYNVNLGDHGGQQRGQHKRRIQNDNLPTADWEAFTRAWAGNLLGVVDGALYVCMSSKEWPLVARVLEQLGAHWSDTLIWAKDRFVLGRADYQRSYEPIWYGWRDGASHYWCGDRDQSDVWQIERPSASDLHPTTKPLALMVRALENSSSPGDLVLDLFLGSGSTLIACERTGRRCSAMEIDSRYAAVSIARWEAFSGETAVRLA